VQYRLSRDAEKDVRAIYQFGIEVFGLEQANSYFDGLFNHLDLMASNPLQYPDVGYIREG
tara:strand:- start:198 stop:377 length:180 start_codon:yes stop_codon:yes gene_type:complete